MSANFKLRHYRQLDCLDGTLLLDLKPYLPRTDSEPGAAIGWMG